MFSGIYIQDPSTSLYSAARVCGCPCVGAKFPPYCRLFLVQASRTNRQDEVRAFFEKMADSLHDRKEWKDWFGESTDFHCLLYTVALGGLVCVSLCAAFPFAKSPEQHPTFRLYYSKEWLDTFQITLHNFFSTLFTSIHILLLLAHLHNIMQYNILSGYFTYTTVLCMKTEC